MSQESTSQTRAWRVPGLVGLECFQATNLVESYGKHSHAAYSIGLIDRGVCVSQFGGDLEHCPSDSLCVINPEQIHAGHVTKNLPLSYRMLYIDPVLWQECLPAEATLPYFRQYTIFDSWWFARLNSLYQTLVGEDNRLAQESCLVEVLSDFTHSYGAGSLSLLAGAEPVAVRQIRDYLQAHYRENVSIQQLTGLTHLNRAYLIRSFQKAVGLPPYAYLLQVRVEQAKKLLWQGMSPAQVAAEVGFTDQSHLTRHFKAITGLTPGRYATGHYRTRK